MNFNYSFVCGSGALVQHTWEEENSCSTLLTTVPYLSELATSEDSSCKSDDGSFDKSAAVFHSHK